jgi:hypothetical protein
VSQFESGLVQSRYRMRSPSEPSRP